MHMHMHMHMHARAHAYTHKYVHTYIRTCMHGQIVYNGEFTGDFGTVQRGFDAPCNCAGHGRRGGCASVYDMCTCAEKEIKLRPGEKMGVCAVFVCIYHMCVYI